MPRPPSGLTGPVTVITGASSGIGRALALELSGCGHRLGLVSRRQDALEALVEEILASNGSALAAPADVGDRDSLRSAISSIVDHFGPVDVLVANAGLGMATHLDPLNITDVEAMFRVNVLGVVYSIESVLPAMLSRKTGQIVAISSLAAFKGLPGESAYCASKAAVNAYCEGLRIALRDRGVVVSTVCPGFVDTPMNTMDSATPFLMSAESAAVRIARIIARRRGGVIRFPFGMSALTSLIARLPDGVVARLVGH